jgi:hypothetical protein
MGEHILEALETAPSWRAEITDVTPESSADRKIAGGVRPWLGVLEYVVPLIITAGHGRPQFARNVVTTGSVRSTAASRGA